MNGEGYTFLPALFSTDMFPYWRISHTKNYVRCDRGFWWNPSATIFNIHTEEDSESHGKGMCYIKVQILQRILINMALVIFVSFCCWLLVLSDLINGCFSVPGVDKEDDQLSVCSVLFDFFHECR